MKKIEITCQEAIDASMREMYKIQSKHEIELMNNKINFQQKITSLRSRNKKLEEALTEALDILESMATTPEDEEVIRPLKQALKE